MGPSNHLENKTPSDIYWRVQLVCKKVLAHSSLEPRNNFALSDAEDKPSGPLNRWGIADLPLLKTLLAIRQKPREPFFWELMDSFVVILAYASLAASRILLQQLLVRLSFTLDSEDLFCWYKRKTWSLWTMAAAQAAKNHGDVWGLT